MQTPLVSGRLRSACVLLALVEQHAETIAAWFARSNDPDVPMSAGEAADNVRDLMQGYAEVLVARSRVLHALDELEAERMAQDPVSVPDTIVRAALLELRTRLSSGVGLIAMEKADLERSLPRRPEALLARAQSSVPALQRFFDEWRAPDPDGWPSEALERLSDGTIALKAALGHAPQPGVATLAHAAALDAFDEAFDDAAELVQAMLQLAERPDAAERLAAGWESPGVVADGAARAAVSQAALATLLGEPSSAPWALQGHRSRNYAE